MMTHHVRVCLGRVWHSIRWSFRELALDALRLFASAFPATYLRIHARLHPEGLVSEYCTGEKKFTLVAVGSGKARHYVLREENLVVAQARLQEPSIAKGEPANEESLDHEALVA